MNYVSVLIVDDDFHKIAQIIQTIKSKYTDTLSIAQASNVQEAIEIMKIQEFHLLITDLLMPLKFDSTPDVNGGTSLVKNIYRGKNAVNVPLFILGLTQYPELKFDYYSIWQVWHYDNTQEKWKNDLRDLIFHISIVKPKINFTKTETIFVEGYIDKKLIEKTFNYFYPDKYHDVNIQTVKLGGGASWVERQLFIWAKSLNKKLDSNGYLKAVGVLDNDSPGNKSFENIRNLISSDSAESKTFSIVRTGYKYSPILKSISSKGIKISTSIEDLIAIEYWEIANQKGWLEKRNLKEEIKLDFEHPEATEINETYLIHKGFSTQETLIILNKIKNERKLEFCNFICNESDLNIALLPIKFLIDDILAKLNLIST